MLKFAIISLFPELFNQLNHSIIKRALNANLINVITYNPRDYSLAPNQRVDDRPYGGGPGMVMAVQPLRDAIEAAKKALPDALCVYLSPKGAPIQQSSLKRYSETKQNLILVCGHYEGIDQRIIDQDIDQQWSLGDFILTGGELAAICVIDALTRLLPGALGHEQSAKQDSFATGLLDHQHYTRPQIIDQQKVPNVLLSGNHQLISQWRAKNALINTWQMRPDLLKNVSLSQEQKLWLKQYQQQADQTVQKTLEDEQ